MLAKRRYVVTPITKKIIYTLHFTGKLETKYLSPMLLKTLNYEQLLKILPIKEKLENVKINGNYIVFNLEKYLDCKNYQLAINDFLNFRFVSDVLK
jgi:hypothetical protein